MLIFHQFEEGHDFLNICLVLNYDFTFFLTPMTFIKRAARLGSKSLFTNKNNKVFWKNTVKYLYVRFTNLLLLQTELNSFNASKDEKK